MSRPIVAAIATAGTLLVLACALGYLDFWVREVFP